jgi:hypothetical protein
MYGPIRGRSIRRRTVRRRPCSRLRFAGLWLRFAGLWLRLAGLRLRPRGLCLYWARVGGARRLCLCWPRVSWRGTRGLGTCRRLLRTSGVASPGFCCRCRAIAGLRFSALVRPGLPVVLWLLRTILGVQGGWQRPDETTDETAEDWPGQQPEGSCLHRYGFPFRCWKNVARVALTGKAKPCVDLPALDAVSWRTGIAARKTAFAPSGDCAERESALESSFVRGGK